MGTPADYTMLVLLAVMAAGLWSLLDKVGQLQRDVEELKRRTEPPPAHD